MLLEEISQGAQVNQIGAEDIGTITQVVAGDAVVEIVAALGIEDEVEVIEDAVPIGTVDMVGHLTLWLVTLVGCVAIWPVTTPGP